MNRYPVLAQTTVGEFLRQPGLRPRIRDIDTNMAGLLKCSGVVHEPRSGAVRTFVRSEDYELEIGDFLVVHEESMTGDRQTIYISVESNDFAFIMGNDSFYRSASAYLARRPLTSVVPRGNIDSLEEILQTIPTGPQITLPISNIIIVSHAAEELLSFKLTDGSSELKIYPDLLCPYVSNAARPQITDRAIRNDANIHIRGCNIGKHEEFLRFIKDIFGGSVTVTAPKHIDFFGGFNYSVGRGYVEHMLYYYKVVTQQRVSSKDELVGLFRDKYELETDIHGNLLTEQNWINWLPAYSAFHPPPGGTLVRLPMRHGCSCPVDPAMYTNRKYHYDLYNPYNFDLSSWRQPGTDPPGEESEILDNLRIVMEGIDEMQTNYPSADCQYPYYTRWGYDSFDDFFDAMHWSTNWITSTRNMACAGTLHQYELRIPIVDDQNSLIINAILNTGNREYMPDCHGIDETDTRLFASV